MVAIFKVSLMASKIFMRATSVKPVQFQVAIGFNFAFPQTTTLCHHIYFVATMIQIYCYLRTLKVIIGLMVKLMVGQTIRSFIDSRKGLVTLTWILHFRDLSSFDQ